MRTGEVSEHALETLEIEATLQETQSEAIWMPRFFPDTTLLQAKSRCQRPQAGDFAVDGMARRA